MPVHWAKYVTYDKVSTVTVLRISIWSYEGPVLQSLQVNSFCSIQTLPGPLKNVKRSGMIRKDPARNQYLWDPKPEFINMKGGWK